MWLLADRRGRRAQPRPGLEGVVEKLTAGAKGRAIRSAIKPDGTWLIVDIRRQ
jgi:hypothetical protein